MKFFSHALKNVKDEPKMFQPVVQSKTMRVFAITSLTLWLFYGIISIIYLFSASNAFGLSYLIFHSIIVIMIVLFGTYSSRRIFIKSSISWSDLVPFLIYILYWWRPTYLTTVDPVDYLQAMIKISIHHYSGIVNLFTTLLYPFFSHITFISILFFLSYKKLKSELRELR